MANKTKKHADKMARKRAVKAARRAQYLSLRGTSKKNKRKSDSTPPSGKKHAHVMADCGNAGCLRCNRQLVS